LSVGESDLAPMAQIGCALMGEGEIRFQDQVMPAADALRAAGLEPIMPEAKDGLALISANSYCVGVGLSTLREAINILASANTIGALSYDGYAASATALRPEVFEARDFAGIRVCGQVFRKLLAGTALEREARALQDPLSFRCIVQVHGAIYDVLMQAADTHLRMLGSGNDSPLIAPDGMYSNGNFESTALALALDQVRVALHRLASLSCERVHKMLWGEFSGLPTSLFPQEEAKNGMFLNNLSRSLSAMMAGVGSLALPSGLSTCSQITAGMDDYQSLAPTSLERLHDQLPVLKRMFAIEALNATRALECRGIPVSPALEDVYHLLLDQGKKLFSAGARMVITDWFNEFPWSLTARLGMPEESRRWLIR
jgi:histidine ammonia-lyase